MFAASQPPLLPPAEPIITLVDGLLEGDHCVADCLAKGNFGLGTLDFLDGGEQGTGGEGGKPAGARVNS